MNLTMRQEMVLRLLAEGHTPKAIWHLLGISRYTFWNHVKDAKERLGADTTIRAVVLFAIEQAGSGLSGQGVLPVSAPPDPIRRSA